MWAQTTQSLEEETGWHGDVALATSGGAETILFVEDESFVREVTSEVLRSAGYRVLMAKNAAEGFHLYDAHCGEVGLVITDVVLPGESGRSLSRRLRCENPELKILLVTGYAEQLGVLEREPEDFLAKPFSTEVLLQRVRQLMHPAESPVEAEAVAMYACGVG